jgi:acyl-CoA synthetase (AMP-forming)/AMP-acid ligase II
MSETAAVATATMPDAMRRVAEAGRGRLSFHGEGATVSLSVAELYERALYRAAQLVGAGVSRGETVGLIGSNAPAWVEWAWGTWLAGAALVPLPAPVRLRDPAAFARQVASLLTATGCSTVVGETRYLAAIDADHRTQLDWDVEPTVTSASVPAELSPVETAVVMCTSGSTAEPKGIRVSHAMLVARSGGAAAVLGLAEGQVPPVVSWLPFYHAGGLATVSGLAVEALDSHVLSVQRFAKDPAEWLRLVSRTRAMATAGPSSGWAAAVRALDRRPEGVDLSCLRVAVFGLELADPEVVDRLLEVCEPLGLRRGAIATGYGLSESGGGTFTRPGGGARIDIVDLDALVSSGLAVPPRLGAPSKRVVSCGFSSPGFEIRVGSPSDPLPDRHVGELLLRSEMNTDGYVNAPSEGLFTDGWLCTGDLGYMADGELFVTGRSKEIIVHLGRNYHPQDIEGAVMRATGATPGSCIAFSPLIGREGDLVVIIEEMPDRDPERLVATAHGAVVNAIGLVPREILVVAPGSIPTAHNGKAQRLIAREMHDQGAFVRSGSGTASVSEPPVAPEV